MRNKELAAREMQVLRLLAKGYLGKEIGSKMGISLRTVEGYRLSIFTKLNALNASHAVAKAIRRGIIE